MAGEPGHRIALPNASILVHQPSGGFQGVASDIQRHAEDILRTNAGISLVVNNAGVGATAPLLASDVHKMDDMIRLNVIALTRLGS